MIWSPNYAPEPTGIPPLVTDAAEWLVDQGHAVDVVTAMPNYPERLVHEGYKGAFWKSERLNGVNVHRSWLRARVERSFIDKALYELTISTFALPNAVRLARRSDVVVCVVPTLLAAAYGALLTRVFRKRYVLWIQDLVLRAAASVDQRGLASHVIRAAGTVDHLVARAADQVVVCSPGFADYYADMGVDGERIATVYNWADLEEIRPQPAPENPKVRFLYAGNVGYTQGLETLVGAARQLPDVVVDIVGSGNAADGIHRLAAQVPNVNVQGPVCRERFPNLLASADVQVVLQRRISAGANLPSKIASYLASGRPIVAAIASNTPAAGVLRESGGAILVEPESEPALADAMRRLASDRGLRAELGAQGRLYAESHFDKRCALQALEQLIFA